MKLLPAGVALAVVAGLVSLNRCGTNDNFAHPSATATVRPADCVTAALSGAGSSFQAPMENQWSSAYLARCSGTHVNYNSVGSGAGIQQFGQGTVDYAGSDVTMKPDEQAAADKRCGGKPAVHIPVTAGGVAITYHLAGVKQLRLSPATIAGIFQGTVKTWDAPPLRADNPGVRLPSTPISVFHRSDGSGTTAVFSAFLAAAAPHDWRLGSGKTLSWPVGQGAKGNEGVSAGVDQTDGGVTYTEQGFAKQKKLPTALVRNAGGSYVRLTSAAVSVALQTAKVVGHGDDLSVAIDYTPTDPAAYPISTVSYVIVCSAYPAGFGPGKLKALKGFLRYAVTDGQQAAEQLGFGPLPKVLADRAVVTLDDMTGG